LVGVRAGVRARVRDRVSAAERLGLLLLGGARVDVATRGRALALAVRRGVALMLSRLQVRQPAPARQVGAAQLERRQLRVFGRGAALRVRVRVRVRARVRVRVRVWVRVWVRVRVRVRVTVRVRVRVKVKVREP